MVSSEAPSRPATNDEPVAVFISYSRSDQNIADEIAKALQYHGGFEILLDRQDIHESEDWRNRLVTLIEGAATVVCLLSPAYLNSPMCQWEIEQSVRVGKRLVPVLLSPVEQHLVPATVSAINYVRFDEGRSFMDGMIALRRALVEDISWLREHARLWQRAREWETAGRPENRLLSGQDIVAAKSWLAAKPANAPDATELHRSFVSESEKSEASRQSSDRLRAERLAAALRRARMALIGVAALALTAVAISLLAGHFWRQAESESLRARSALSRALAERAVAHLDDGRRETGLRYAIASRRISGEQQPFVDAVLKRASGEFLMSTQDAELDTSTTPDAPSDTNGDAAVIPAPLQILVDAPNRRAFAVFEDHIELRTPTGDSIRAILPVTSPSLAVLSPDVARLTVADKEGRFFATSVAKRPYWDWEEIIPCTEDGPYQALGQANAFVFACPGPDQDGLLEPRLIPATGAVELAQGRSARASREHDKIVEFDFTLDNLRLFVWDRFSYVRASGALGSLKGYGYAMQAPTFFAGGNRLSVPGDSVSSTQASATVFEVSRDGAGHPVWRNVLNLESDRYGFGEIAGAADGKHIVSTGGELSEIDMRMWSIATGEEIVRFPGSQRAFLPSFHPSGELIAAIVQERRLKIWTTDGVLVWDTLMRDPIYQFAFAADGRAILIATQSRIVEQSLEALLTESDELEASMCRLLRAKQPDNPLSGMVESWTPDVEARASSFTPDELVADPLLREVLIADGASRNAANTLKGAAYDVCPIGQIDR